MTRKGGGDTVNKGPAPRSRVEDQPDARRPEDFDITGNVELEGEDPSPDDRARGETSRKDRAAPTDR
jgi:hypothetical protein